MENNEILDLLEQEYLQEYRNIQNRLLKTIRESSYMNVEPVSYTHLDVYKRKESRNRKQ